MLRFTTASCMLRLILSIHAQAPAQIRRKWLAVASSEAESELDHARINAEPARHADI